MEKQIEQLAKDIHEATRKAGNILVEETRKFVKQYHHYSSKNDFDKAHTKTLAELEAEYLFEQGYRKQVEAEWVEVKTGFICSNCKEHFPSNRMKYCYECGAKMKGAE